MNDKMIEAIRKEAFVQGFLRGYAWSHDLAVSDFTDEKLLRLLPLADKFYIAFRTERSK